MVGTCVRLATATLLVLSLLAGWGSAVGAWSTGAGGDPNWGSTTFGGTGFDWGGQVAVDGSGNVYTTGYFNNTVNFGAGDVTSAGSYDVFVTKLNSAGAHQWTTTLGGTGAELAYSVAVDGSGNVYTTGYFTGTANFGAGNVTSAGIWDVFVTKLNSAGAHQWTTTFGGTDSEVGYSVAVDGSGNVYTTGQFNGT
ncbi:MAG: SBBP repeat-containing protein, partial [Actinomycetota bacterium]|nr:SBBP repeat-containing protein [Actinomycetota bacterium]